MVRNVHEPFLRFFNPVIGCDFSTRITEAAFAGVGDIVLRSALFTLVQTISEFFFVSAVHHFFHILFYTLADIVYA